MNKLKWIGVVLVAVVAAACSKPESSATPAPGVAAVPAAAQPAAWQLPQPDRSVPLEQYREITSGHDLMFLWLANARMPVDHAKVADDYSDEYRRTQDAFRKNDLLAALKPRIDEGIAHARQSPYLIWDSSESSLLDHYDFDSKSFLVRASVLQPTAYGYFNGSRYKIAFSAGPEFQRLKVEDEALARRIESMIGKYPPLRAKVYAFAQDGEPDSLTLRCKIVAIKILTDDGQELAMIKGE